MINITQAKPTHGAKSVKSKKKPEKLIIYKRKLQYHRKIFNSSYYNDDITEISW